MFASPESAHRRREFALDLSFDVVSDLDIHGLGLDPGAVEALCRFVLRHEELGDPGPWEVTLALVDDDALRDLHARFMGLDTVTDVMTFPLDGGGPRGGDIVVSVDRAAAQGPDHGLTAMDEVRFLFVHGLLHLCGWEDGTTAQRERMLARQGSLLGAFEAVPRASG